MASLSLVSQVVILESCGGHPCVVGLAWRDGRDRLHIVGLTECGRILGNDPNMARSVLFGYLGRVGGRRGGARGGGGDLIKKQTNANQRYQEEHGGGEGHNTEGG